MVLLNAAAGLYVAGKVGSMADGIELSAQTIDDGKASDLLERYRVGSNA